MKTFNLIASGLLLLVFTGCTDIITPRDSYSHVTNFKRIERYGNRAADAYNSDKDIKKEYGKLSKISVDSGDKQQLQWFVQSEDFPSNNVWISIRGTANLTNVASDLAYTKNKDKLTNVFLHSGFAEATKEIYPAIKKNLKKKSDIYITGHSLGGAAAVITMMWLKEEGFDVKFCYTFGQPKVTNSAGRKKYKDLPLIRVINQGDPVPYMPPTTALSSIGGGYRHFGDAVILTEDDSYVYLENHDASKSNIGSLWNKIASRALSAHKMANYLKNIAQKLDRPRQIPWTPATANSPKKDNSKFIGELNPFQALTALKKAQVK